VQIETPVKNFAAVEVLSGALLSTNNPSAGGATLFAADDIPIKLKRGSLSFKPDAGDNATPSATVSSLVVADGAGTLAVTKGSNTSASLTLGSMTRNDGGILEVRPSAFANLGVSEKVLVTGKEASASAEDGGLVAFDGNAVKFLQYDADNGFIAASDTPANAVVIGSATDASGTATSHVDPIDFTATGKDGFIWRPASTKGQTTFYATNSLVSSKCVTFASHPATATQQPIINFGTLSTAGVKSFDPQWTFPLRFSGVRTGYLYNHIINKCGDVYVEGSMADATTSAGLNLGNNIYTYSLSEDVKKGLYCYATLHISGGGYGLGALYIAESQWWNAFWTQNGKTILEDDAAIGTGGDTTRTFSFYGPIEGNGLLNLMSGQARFYGTNTFSGGLSLSANTVLTARGKGTLGTGPISLAAGSRLYFTSHDPITVNNKITGSAASVIIQKSNVTLAGETSFKRLVVQQTGNLVIGSSVTCYQAELDGDATITAADGSTATFTIGEDTTATNRIAAVMSDGAGSGTLSFVKQGGNVVEIYGTNTYSGQTIVKGGTLRLASDFMTIPDLSYWLDATDASTFSYDDNNRITNWCSKVGSFKFVDPKTKFSSGTVQNSRPERVISDAEAGENYFNNNPFVRFRGSNTIAVDKCDRLYGSDSIQQRTIFIVCRTKTGDAYTHGSAGGMFGIAGQDISLRLNSSGTFNASLMDSGATLSSAGYGYQNGVKNTGYISTVALSGANIITVLHPRDVLEASYQHTSTFKPALGGCNTDCRNWGGDIGEVIAFSRTLTSAERCTIENYLMKKWNPQNTISKLHSDAECAIPKAENLLPVDTDMTIHTGATIDLNGISQKVRTLKGEGTIINTSTNAAVLTITAGGDFHGTIKGNIKVVRTSGAGAGEVDNVALLIREGGTFVAEGNSTTTFSAYNPAPITNDVAFWLDASLPDTIHANSDGWVTNWQCRATSSSVCGFMADQITTSAVYKTTGFNGVKPSVYFQGSNARMRSCGSDGVTAASATVRTVFIVAHGHYKNDYRYTFGRDGVDQGHRIIGSKDSSDQLNLYAYGSAGLAHVGDTVRVNGVDYSSLTVRTFAIPSVYCLVTRIEDVHAEKAPENIEDIVWALGAYHSTKSVVAAQVDFAEVLAYTRKLSDYEMLLVENYLMEKWIRSGASWPTEETQAFDSTCGLGVSGGARIDFNGADLTLASVAGSGGGFTNFKTLTVTDRIDLLLDGNNCVTSLDIGSADSHVTFGTEANGYSIPVNLTNASQINRLVHRQNAVKVTGTLDNGTLTFANPPKGWRFLKDGSNPLWFFLHNGTMLLIR